MTDPAWTEYLRGAQRLDEVRRSAAAAAAEQVLAAHAARGELDRVRGRLALQQPRLHEATGQLGPAGPGLAPTAADVAAAAQSIGDDPAAVLDALRRNWSTVEQADAAVLAAQSRGGSPADWPPRLRNLLVYGALGLAVLVVQLVLFALASETSLPLYAPLCGLVLPAGAFGLGFVLIGLLFPAPPGGRVDRTPVLGAAVCLASVVVLCAGLGVLIVFRS